eukprot:TRINITY_DN418_c0_g1_i2.p3 TRINITY_DN418_c0_g1~~TRINITY_DN418_c0_g1_i2.p3  ORF type:complete len:111 (-),score=0.43 TRINITY_DN418_c0_g1_i2:225-557(-)
MGQKGEKRTEGGRCRGAGASTIAAVGRRDPPRGVRPRGEGGGGAGPLGEDLERVAGVEEEVREQGQREDGGTISIAPESQFPIRSRTTIASLSTVNSTMVPAGRSARRGY